MSFTNGGRLRLAHPKVSQIIYTGPNPSDHRSILNLESQVKRAARSSGLVAAEQKPTSVLPTPRPKKRRASSKARSFTDLPLISDPVDKRSGFAMLAELAEKKAQERQQEVRAAWRLYCLGVLLSERPNPWRVIAQARHVLDRSVAAQERVVAAYRQAGGDGLRDARERWRGRIEQAKQKEIRRLAVAAVVAAFRVAPPPAPPIVEARSLEAKSAEVSSPSPKEPNWPERLLAWRFAALKMRLGGARWKAIRANRRMKGASGKLIRERAVAAYRAAPEGEIAELRTKLRAGLGIAKEIHRSPQIVSTRIPNLTSRAAILCAIE